VQNLWMRIYQRSDLFPFEVLYGIRSRGDAFLTSVVERTQSEYISKMSVTSQVELEPLQAIERTLSHLYSLDLKVGERREKEEKT
jgi:hypothetical protein